MSKVPKVPSAALLIALICTACTPFNVLKPDGGDGPAEVGGDSPGDNAVDSPAEEAAGQDGPVQEAPVDGPMAWDAAVDVVEVGPDVATDRFSDAVSEMAHDGGIPETATDAADEPPKTNLALWLVADRGITLTDGLVSRWTDQSGRGIDAYQDGAAGRPVLLPGALAGKPVVRFEGFDLMYLDAGFSDLTKGVVILVVARVLRPLAIDSSPVKAVFILDLSGASPDSIISLGTRIEQKAGTDPVALLQYEAGGTFPERVEIQMDQWQLLESDNHPGVPGGVINCETYVNAALADLATCPTPPVTLRNDNVLGQVIAMTADIAELLVYDASDLAVSFEAENYLLKKWGLGK